MNQEKIIEAIAAYLQNADWNWRLPASTSAEKIATDIAAAISLHLEAGAGWKPQIDEMVLVDGKIEGSFRGMRAGLACIAFKGGMQMNIALDRVTPG